MCVAAIACVVIVVVGDAHDAVVQRVMVVVVMALVSRACRLPDGAAVGDGVDAVMVSDVACAVSLARPHRLCCGG